jgi:hypothetical protein
LRTKAARLEIGLTGGKPATRQAEDLRAKVARLETEPAGGKPATR